MIEQTAIEQVAQGILTLGMIVFFVGVGMVVLLTILSLWAVINEMCVYKCGFWEGVGGVVGSICVNISGRVK